MLDDFMTAVVRYQLP